MWEWASLSWEMIGMVGITGLWQYWEACGIRNVQRTFVSYDWYVWAMS